MEVVPEEVCTVHTSMTIEYSEISDFFPFCAVLRLGDVEDDGDPVLVVVSDWSLVGRGSVGLDEAIGL